MSDWENEKERMNVGIGSVTNLIKAADQEIAKLIEIIADYEQITGPFDTAEELIEHLHSLEDSKDAELARLRKAFKPDPHWQENIAAAERAGLDRITLSMPIEKYRLMCELALKQATE